MGNDNNLIKNAPLEGTKLAEIKIQKKQKVVQTTNDAIIEHLAQPNIQGNKNNVIINNNYLEEFLSENIEELEILRIAHELYPDMNKINKTKYHDVIMKYLEYKMSNIVKKQQEDFFKPKKLYKVQTILYKLLPLWFPINKKQDQKNGKNGKKRN